MHNWWQMPLKNLSLIGVLGTTLLVGIVAPIGARLVLSLFPRTFSLAELAERMALVIIPILVVVLGLALFYRMAPRRQTRFSEVWIAAVGAALLLKLVQSLFILYMTNFARFNAVYGTFAGIMALLTWIYLSGCIVVLGACISAAHAELKK